MNKKPTRGVEFFRGYRRRWVAAICQDGVCVSWQTVGTMKNVKRAIKTQLEPKGIIYCINELEG